MVFSFLILLNIRRPTRIHQSRHSMDTSLPVRVAPVSLQTQNTSNLRRSKYSNQFIVLSILQALTFVLLNSLRASYRLFVLVANPDATVGTENWSTFLSFFNSFSIHLVYTYTAVSYSTLTMNLKYNFNILL